MALKLTCARGATIMLLALTTTVQTVRAQSPDNPLLQRWDTPFGAPPFDRIGTKDFVPAFEAAMQGHLAEIEAITSNGDAPTFDNTVAALEKAGKDLARVQRTFFALTSSATSDDLRAIQSRMAPRLAAHSSAITLNAALFARIDALFAKRATLGLDAEQSRVIELTHNRFVRAGAKIQGEARERLAAITEELAGLYTAFSQNVQKSAEAFALVDEVRPVGHRDLGRAGAIEDVDHDLVDQAHLGALDVLLQPLRHRHGVELAHMFRSPGRRPAQASAHLVEQLEGPRQLACPARAGRDLVLLTYFHISVEDEQVVAGLHG